MLETDVVVVGGGIAGSAGALAAARKGAEVLLLIKLPDPEETNTRHAQGGIIYTGPGDSPELLVDDILEAGDGVGDPDAAHLLATEGPPLVRRLLIEECGVPFDRDGNGELHLTREAAHSVPRIIHHGDTTGAEIQHALARAVRDERHVSVLPEAKALDLVTSGGRCTGICVSHRGEVATLASRDVVARDDPGHDGPHRFPLRLPGHHPPSVRLAEEQIPRHPCALP